MATAEDIIAAIHGFEFHYSDEHQLQEGLAAALTERGFDVRREVRLNSHDRIDLVVDRVGIEVKIQGRAASVQRQCRRYLASDALDEVVLVTSRPRHSLIRMSGVTVLTVLSPW